MPLIAETGTGDNTAANSYVTLAEARTLAAAMGITISGDDATADSQLSRAVTYLEGYRDRFQGHTSQGNAQPLAWPRRLAMVDNTEIPDDEIPLLLRKAQVAAAAVINGGVDLMPVDDGRFIVKEKVDVIETEYSEKLSERNAVVYPLINAYLKPLLVSDAGGWDRY